MAVRGARAADHPRVRHNDGCARARSPDVRAGLKASRPRAAAVKIGGVEFAGPYEEERLQGRPGVYVVLDERYHNGEPWHNPVYVGEAELVHREVWEHPDRECWDENVEGMIVFAVLYMDGLNVAHRRRIATEVAAECREVPCGDP